MTAAGADYAFTHPSPAALKAAGITFVCRYLSTDPAKDINATELAALHEAGISVVLNWETTADFTLGGASRGMVDARSARAQANALGAPGSIPIYYSADFDVTSSQIATVLDYLHGAADAEGSKSLVGVYGGYAVVKAAIDAGFLGWQTYAWSGGQWDPRAVIRQTHNGQDIGGVSIDLDEAVAAEFGQWAPATAATTASTAPPWPGRQLHLTSPHMTGTDVREFQARLIARGWNLGPGGADSNFGPITEAKTKAFQLDSTAHGWPLAPDGICGEHTWAAAFERPISH